MNIIEKYERCVYLYMIFLLCIGLLLFVYLYHNDPLYQHIFDKDYNKCYKYRGFRLYINDNIPIWYKISTGQILNFNKIPSKCWKFNV